MTYDDGGGESENECSYAHAALDLVNAFLAVVLIVKQKEENQ